VTVTGGPNLAYDLCRRAVSPEQRAKLDLSCWQVAIVSGDAVQPRTLWQFSHGFAACGFQSRTFAPCYGLAEATLMVTGRRRGEAPVVRAFDADALAGGRVRTVLADVGHLLAGCGRPHADRPVRIVRPDTATECGDDEVGEIWVSGPSVAPGYWRRPEGAPDPFGARIAGTDEGPFLRTGDLGFLANGELFVLGRMRDVVTIHGRAYHPQDIEEVVDASHTSLRPGGGAAFSVPVAGEEALVVVHEVQPNTLSMLDADAITLAVRVALGETLGLHARDVVLLRPGGLPRTQGGRVHRRACRELYHAGSLSAVATRPVGPVHHIVARPCAGPEGGR
jgi:acyl-CoA synthetase (AMP-forming)/AMP-acid ligase II